MSLKNFALAFLLGALLAGGVAWLLAGPAALRGEPSPHSAGEGDETETARSKAIATRAPSGPTLVGSADASTDFAALRSENVELRAEVAALEAKVEALRPKPRDPRAFRFGVPGQAPSFDRAEWKALAGHMEELTGHLAKLKDTVTSGKQPSAADVAAIRKSNAPLASFAVSFGADLEDLTANGAYTHPAVVANLIRAALAEAAMALSEEQEISIQALGNAWIGEQERVDAGFPSDAPLLAKTVQEVDAKLRFLASLQPVLTQAQRAVLFPPETTGRLKLDLLSPALVYVLSYPVQATGADDMEQRLVTQLFRHAAEQVEDLEPYAWIGREWVDAIPGAATPQAQTSIDLTFPHVDQVQMRARAQANAIERVLAMNLLSEDHQARLRALQTLLYPFVLVGQEE